MVGRQAAALSESGRAAAVAVQEHPVSPSFAAQNGDGPVRLSLRATQPDPFQAFADSIAVGQMLQGQITKLVPFGVFVQVADGIEGLVHLQELTSTPAATPQDVVEAGDEVTVLVMDVDRERRRLTSQHPCGSWLSPGRHH
ncbi:S1 RNA-binding domain-containing protein [Streptomyces sp. NBC_01363]|uniref:S1 RNA-binding domain-containing protein n=1 Tax=Streptomyces sp. NBC_01363 TaxID=2903840 RepID=UPI00225C370B|nr:S1 RNA-binding domain-containing protein [Streptomyces sp. NBC_01363]MCX4733767.1 S1 RNA-binding domain-containing protein [Streptomyces sp. NBC_01363]